jgi:hypothetical protein
MALVLLYRPTLLVFELLVNLISNYLDSSMKTILRIVTWCVLVATAMQVSAAELSVFEARRGALMDMLDGRVAVLYGAQAQVGGVVEELFIQESNFYYLTGISEPGAALILAPEEKQYQEILY